MPGYTQFQQEQEQGLPHSAAARRPAATFMNLMTLDLTMCTLFNVSFGVKLRVSAYVKTVFVITA